MTISATTQGIRPGVATSTNRPTVPFDGQVIFETDTENLKAYNGSAWVSQNSLQFIAASGAQSAQASISFNNCFSATYMNYRIIMENVIQSVAANSQIRLRVGGVDTSGTGYHSVRVEANNTPTVSGVATNAASSWGLTYIANSTDGTSLILDVFRPFATSATMVVSQAARTDSTTAFNTVTGGGYHNAATSFDGFSIVPSSGTVSCTNIRVYGYGNS